MASCRKPPRAPLMALNCARSERTQTNRRCEPIGTFSGSVGAGLAKFHATSPTAVAISLARAIESRGCEAARSTRRARASGTFARPPNPLAASCAEEGWGEGDPVVIGFDRLGHWLDVEKDGGDVDARDAVDQRVVGLGDDRKALAREPLDEPELPERLCAVELLREDSGGQVAQLLLGAGRRQRGVAHVVLEVEGRIVHPEWAASLDRRIASFCRKRGTR